MKAVGIRQFGPVSAIEIQILPRPEPSAGEVLVRVQAAGVGPWDAWVREGKSEISQPLPLILGADFAGIVEAVGSGASDFKAGDEIYGATNERFTGAYAEYALASAKMIAKKPRTLSWVEAASAPVVAVTAWQMLFDYARAAARQTALILGGAGNVGAYAVQLASGAGVQVIATAGSADLEYVKNLGAAKVVNYRTERFEETLTPVDIVIDTVGGDTQERSLQVLKPGGIIVSIVSPVSEAAQRKYGVKASFFLVAVTTARLNAIRELFDTGKLLPQVGTVLPLEQARTAHEMLAGAPHKRGKIVLSVAG